MVRYLSCLIIAYATILAAVGGKRLPEASSTLLKMHKLYQQQSPHDTTLYDILQVKPNATEAQITKSYRILSRKYHPDKTGEEAEETLQRVRDAYEVLKDDATRLPYHQYGLLEVSDAAFLLTGATSPKTLSVDQQRLLHLMGYYPGQRLHQRHPEDRVLFLAAHIAERIRPLVEDVINPADLEHSIAEECMILKRLPLGAQILRCIGRAYRHAGQRVLREDRFKKVGELSNMVRASLHKTQYILEAAAAGSKMMVKEKIMVQSLKQQQHQSNDGMPRIGYMNENDYDSDEHLEENLKQAEREKALSVELESLQIEALWKITKIHLDRAIRNACKKVLDENYFAVSSDHHHQQQQQSSYYCDDWAISDDGWVTSKGQTIKTSIGRLRAASALVMVGDVMVKCANYEM